MKHTWISTSTTFCWFSLLQWNLCLICITLHICKQVFISEKYQRTGKFCTQMHVSICRFCITSTVSTICTKIIKSLLFFFFLSKNYVLIFTGGFFSSARHWCINQTLGLLWSLHWSPFYLILSSQSNISLNNLLNRDILENDRFPPGIETFIVDMNLCW